MSRPRSLTTTASSPTSPATPLWSCPTDSTKRARRRASRSSAGSYRGEKTTRARPCAVAVEEAWIPLADGVRLAADLWRPKGPGDRGKFPVLLEYLPYRKTEGRSGSYPLYAWFVRRGYVVARVDIRGTGNSEGTLLPDENSEIEQRAGDEVIAWLARPPFP